MEIVELNSGSVHVEKEFLEVLVALKLDTLRGVFEYAGEGYLRTHGNRDNFHIAGRMGRNPYDLYLKRHRGLELKETIKLLASDSPFAMAGRREWENMRRLEALGVKTARRVAFGQKWIKPFELKSFVITEAIPGGVPLDEYIAGHFQGTLSEEALREKRALLWDLGDLVRRLHQAGLTHMDLYLNHFFVRETPEGDKVLYLIDLQRVAKRWLFKRRWVVKDLAALFYSARNLPLDTTDLARVLNAYFDGAFPAGGRALVRAAAERARRMTARSA
jgi:hypothetical protein